MSCDTAKRRPGRGHIFKGVRCSILGPCRDDRVFDVSCHILPAETPKHIEAMVCGRPAQNVLGRHVQTRPIWTPRWLDEDPCRPSLVANAGWQTPTYAFT